MKKLVISDASTLILLEKIGLLSKITGAYSILIPKEVETEAVERGVSLHRADAFRLQEKIKKKQIVVEAVKKKEKYDEIRKTFNIGEGESAAIALWFSWTDATLAIDDHKAMNVCKIYEIPFVTALTMIIVAFEGKSIEKKQAYEMIRELDIHGRYKAELIYEAKKLLGENNDKT